MPAHAYAVPVTADISFQPQTYAVAMLEIQQQRRYVVISHKLKLQLKLYTVPVTFRNNGWSMTATCLNHTHFLDAIMYNAQLYETSRQCTIHTFYVDGKIIKEPGNRLQKSANNSVSL